MEIITTVIGIIFAIIIVGIVVDGFDKGMKNLSKGEEILFLIAILAIIIVIVL